jgi:hypothetical protein
LGDFFPIGRQAFQHVVTRVYCPNDFIHAARQFTRRVVNSADPARAGRPFTAVLG